MSIGYSTCHWCHVMAHESFEDEDVADVLNSGFVSVKVDREQRPDIDEVYMSVCQAMTGSGGWPLSIFMDADKRPFFAGTYFPRDSAFGRIGFIELCANIQRVWKTDRQALLENSSRIISHLTKKPETSGPAQDAGGLADGGYSHLEASFDSLDGGFSPAPKFPSAQNLLFLLKYYKAKKQPQALFMAEHTLERICSGGIYDHVGGGISRYSTDEKWLVPHFEKMLYDNAMLLLACSEAFAATKKDFYKQVIDSICGYVLRDMSSPSGGFYCAEDADSQGGEGRFYVFGWEELTQSFSPREMRILQEDFGVTRQGSFEGSNIISLASPGAVYTQEQESILKKLYGLREKRPRPFRDEKISVSWNGLMIQALCRAGQATGNMAYIERAKAAAAFITGVAKEHGGLFGIYKEGSTPSSAFLSDYANFANALISLYSAVLDISFLKEAIHIAETMVTLFREEGRFYMTPKGADELFYRPKDEYDGALPSGSSCAAECLQRLSELTGSAHYSSLLNETVESFSGTAKQMPGAYLHFLSSLLSMQQPRSQIVIAASRDDDEALEAYRIIQSRYMPFTTVIYYDGSTESKEVFPLLTGYGKGRSFAAYVCQDFACRNPVFSPAELLSLVEPSL